MDSYSALLISDFNAQTFADYLSNDEQEPLVNVRVSDFGLVIPPLLDGNLACWREPVDFTIVWTRPESVIPSFAAVLDFKQVDEAIIHDEVRAFAELLVGLQERVRFAFVPSWTLATHHNGYGFLDMRVGLGIRYTLMRMNLTLAEALKKARNIYLLDSQRWLDAAGKDAFNPKLWYLTKNPLSNNVYKAATTSVKAALKSIDGAAKKLILVDLDDTLWGGIVGDLRWQNLRLGGHDYIGEAFLDFQRALRGLKNRGILIGIVSKNDESVALEALQRHPEMVLQLEDFVGWRINWHDKAHNIVELVEELNLGLQSVVFIDDNPVERARVRDMLPEVLVPEWPLDKTEYARTLLELSVFDTAAITEEDLSRTEIYRSAQRRQKSRSELESVEAWLETLETKVKVEELNSSNLQRATQLLNKTNQMNLSTRRLTDFELADWAAKPNHKVWTLRISDKFGDSGLTGLLSIETINDVARIVDFVLSCRIMGRMIEEVMTAIATNYARFKGASVLEAQYLPTEKNKPCLAFWKRSGFEQKENQLFVWSVERAYKLPTCITLDLTTPPVEQANLHL